MKLLKTISKLVEESEIEYNSACDRCADEKTIKRLEKNYYDSLKLLERVNKVQSDEKNTNHKSHWSVTVRSQLLLSTILIVTCGENLNLLFKLIVNGVVL